MLPVVVAVLVDKQLRQVVLAVPVVVEQDHRATLRIHNQERQL
jgi:hypothetical protein